MYRPGKLNGNADPMSSVPLPATKDALSATLRLTDATDIDVYFIGASGVQPRLRRQAGTILGGLAMQAGNYSDWGKRKY